VTDIGLTHVVSRPGSRSSIAFYRKYARMKRKDATTGFGLVWRSDHTHPFVTVLVQVPEAQRPLGTACTSLVSAARGQPSGHPFIFAPRGHSRLDLTSLIATCNGFIAARSIAEHMTC
jgi:hypothetical protein